MGSDCQLCIGRCHHWGAGTDEPYHVEWMAEHEDHTENTGCAVPEGTGWCYCVANAGLPADLAVC